METWDTVRARRNVRNFTDEPLSEDELRRILEAGRRTPSSRNQQSWDFVVVTDRDQLLKLAKVWRGAGFVGLSAATVALIAPKTDEHRRMETIQYDLGQVTMSMMIAAADLGIGSGHAAVADQDLARRLLRFPEEHLCAWLIAFGFPDDRALAPIEKPNRKPLDEIVHLGQWRAS